MQCANIKDALYQLTRDIYEAREVPYDYDKNIIVTISKKISVNSCDQFWTISLSISKILTKLIDRRIERKVKLYLKNDQYEFRRQKGIREAILGLRVLIAKQINIFYTFVLTTYLVFIDLVKVNCNKNVSNITRDRCWTTWSMNHPQSLQKSDDLYQKEGITANAQIKRGVRQECTLSPSLFNCYIKKVINIMKAKLTRQNIGINIGGEIVSMICFADVIVMIAESEGDIQSVSWGNERNAQNTRNEIKRF